MKLYLASPFFNEIQRENVKTMAAKLRDLGFDVYVPMEHDVEDAWEKPNHIWAKEVFEADVAAIQAANIVVALIYGMTDDAGTAWEIGYAYGIGKSVYPIPFGCAHDGCYSLMVFNGCTNILSKTLMPISTSKFEQS